jgi:hypothetical protein
VECVKQLEKLSLPGTRTSGRLVFTTLVLLHFLVVSCCYKITLSRNDYGFSREQTESVSKRVSATESTWVCLAPVLSVNVEEPPHPGTVVHNELSKQVLEFVKRHEYCTSKVQSTLQFLKWSDTLLKDLRTVSGSGDLVSNLSTWEHFLQTAT